MKSIGSLEGEQYSVLTQSKVVRVNERAQRLNDCCFNVFSKFSHDWFDLDERSNVRPRTL